MVCAIDEAPPPMHPITEAVGRPPNAGFGTAERPPEATTEVAAEATRPV